MTEEQENDAKTLIRKLKENQGSIFIGRVPPQTKELFEKLAHEEFCDDFGFTLKWLIETAYENDVRDARIDDLQEQIEALKGALVQDREERSTRKMVDGTKKKVKA